MSERITNQNVRSVFALWCKAHGFRQATAYNDVGGFSLDHAPEYGGWNIVQVMNESGGINLPFGVQRHSNREMWDMLRFSVRAVEVAKEERVDVSR